MIMLKIPLTQLQVVKFLLAMAILLYVPGLASGALSINQGGESFTVSVLSYEYPYIVSNLILKDTGETLIISGIMTIEKNATLTAKTDINLGYVSAKSADAKIDIETAAKEKLSVSAATYKFSKDAFTDGSKFTFTVPRIPGEIHFGKNSTILIIESWSCGYKVNNTISYDYLDSAINPESFGFSGTYGGIHHVWFNDGTKYEYNDACNSYIYGGVHITSIADQQTGSLIVDYTSSLSPTHFLFNQTSKRGATNITDMIYYGYPWIISVRYVPSAWLYMTAPRINGNQISSPCGDDMTGMFNCNLLNVNTSRRYGMIGRNAADTFSYITMFDKNIVNSSNSLVLSFTDSSYDYLYYGTEDGTSTYLPPGISYSLHGYMTFLTTHEESYYGNITFDHFFVYPNPTVTASGGDTFLFNNFKLINVEDTDANGIIILNVVPNSLNNGTWWYFDFPGKTIQNLQIDINNVICYYVYNSLTFQYETAALCPFIDEVEVSNGEGIGTGEITSVAILNYKFSNNASQTMSIEEYFPPPPVLNATLTCDVCHDLPVKLTICADDSTLRTIRERTSCVSGACETYNQTDNQACVNGCYDGLTVTGAGCAPMNLEVLTLGFVGFLIMISGIYFISGRFNRGSRKKGRF